MKFFKLLSFSVFIVMISNLYSIENLINPNVFFNTKLLKNHTLTSILLEYAGFEKQTFAITEKNKLSCYYRTHPNAKYNLICHPGCVSKEQCASIFSLLMNQPINFLFIDDYSVQSIFSIGLPWHFGLNEHNHIIGALNFIKEKNNLPIIIHGMCAGGFYATHALLKLQEQDILKNYPVAGLILDSVWPSRLRISRVLPITRSLEYASQFFLNQRNYKKVESNSFFFRIYKATTVSLLNVIHKIFFTPYYYLYENETNIQNKIHKINCPIFFIHAYDDWSAPIKDVQKLAQSCKAATTWWIDTPSKHGCNLIKYKDEYRDRVISFIEQKCLPQGIPL